MRAEWTGVEVREKAAFTLIPVMEGRPELLVKLKWSQD